jgi:hypothetical protein
MGDPIANLAVFYVLRSKELKLQFINDQKTLRVALSEIKKRPVGEDLIKKRSPDLFRIGKSFITPVIA